MKRFLLVQSLLLLFFANIGKAQQQEQSDSLVRLLSAQKMEQVDRNGQSYRKVTGPARFLHNNTYLICDTAFWNMNTSIIECINNVSIIQEDTKLTSDKLIYLVDEDLAQFRGTLVQLEDKDGNLLRTRHLDYNTKDSVATFLNGGAMKDKEGQLIESITGIYESKIKLFTFNGNVNMYTDSVFIKTTKLRYYTESGMAYFGTGTDAWKEENMLSSDAGWYDRPKELFLFTNDVHAMNDRQEVWADSLYYKRLESEVELLGNAQLSDTTRDAYSMAGRMLYVDSLSRVTLTRDPVVIGIQKTEEKADTVYARADKMVYYTLPRCEVDSSVVYASRSRLEDVNADAVAQYRQKAAEQAAKAAEEAKKNNPDARPDLNPNNASRRKAGAAKENDSSEETEAPKEKTRSEKVDRPKDEPAKDDNLSKMPQDTLAKMPPKDTLTKTASDSLAMPPLDSLATSPADSLAAIAAQQPKDSTKIGFIRGIGNFKLYKSDLQMVSDSLEYTDLDSLVRLYKRPLVWNEKNRQYSADSIFVAIKNGTLDKASLMSDAFVIIREDSLSFDQIRSVEMMAYFDTSGTISRFDAMGDADAIFYIQEDSTYATVNFSKSKILSALFKEGGIDQVHYFDESKSDAYPVAQITKEQRELKGFNWTPSKRPLSKADITDKKLRPSERKDYAARPRATFRETNIYFPGYMEELEAGLQKAREDRRLRRQEEARRKQEEERLAADSTKAAAADSLFLKDADSLSVKALKDSLSTSKSVADSLAGAKDSLANAKPLTEKELKKQEAERIRLEKKAKKEKEWARLDSLDAAKAAEKAQAKQEKLRRKKLKLLEKMYREQEKENAILQKYIEYYRRKKEAEERKKAAKEGRLNVEEELKSEFNQ